MTPEKSAAIKKAMVEAAAKASAEAVAKFGQVGADACEALADLMNQMKFFVQIIDGDMAEYAMAHASFTAQAKTAICVLGRFDPKEFEAMMFRLAESRLYIHHEGRPLDG